MSDVTRILDRVQQGDPKAADELLPLVYEELRRLAAVRMAQEQANHTLQPTALVHEAWMRLTGGEQPAFDGCGPFFAAAAEAMRRILIENARRKGRLKRGSEWERVDLEHLDVAVTTNDDTLLAVHEALEKLAAIDPVGAKLIELRFFAGLSNVDAAKAPRSGGAHRQAHMGLCPGLAARGTHEEIIATAVSSRPWRRANCLIMLAQARIKRRIGN